MLIVAVDFDGTLCDDKFPEIGVPNWKMIDLVLYLQQHEVYTILWTCRVDDKLNEAVSKCEEWGLKFTSINDNVPHNIDQYKSNSRKVFADVYIDDKSVLLTDSLFDSMKMLISVTQRKE